MKFGIITYILHKEKNGKIYSYAPYIAEMNMWIRNAEKTLIAAPKISGTISPIEIPYLEAELEFYQIPALNFTNLRNIIISLLRMPKVILGIWKVMRKSDHIHLRCPGNISLIACFLQIFFPKKPKTVKYAGNWDPEAKQPWSYKLQQKILSNTFLSRNVQVLVYGDWPNRSVNIVPFFTASFSESEKINLKKQFITPFKFLFVGSLVEGKNPLFAIRLIEALMAKAIPGRLDLYGDGILRSELEQYVGKKNLNAFITFQGNQPLEEVKQAYKSSHFLILASKSEGWPKAVAEGMFFGCIPIVTGVSCVPWMLGGGSRGILMSEGNAWDENLEDSGHPPLRFGQGGQRTENSHDGLGKVVGGLLDTFQKRRQFECFPDSPKGERGNLSRTVFSETPAYRQGRLEVTESGNVIDDTIVKIIELINNPEEMRRMSMEAQEWSQQYTLERFEDSIKKILSNKSSSPFGRGGGEG